ncbi:MAG TPA: bifunctional lysylphosphatidylglycerol flippase/synthetase MprF [Candidatus Gracilibacteria bacterium]
MEKKKVSPVQHVARPVQVLGKFTPIWLSVTTFLAGAMLIVSGTLPVGRGRMHFLRTMLPLPAIEVSHFFASLVGVSLLVLARAILDRVNVAYYATIALLMFGIVLSLSKAFDYEQAAIFSFILLAFLPAKKHFYKKSSIFSPEFTVGWIFSITMALLLALGLGLFLYQNVEYHNDIWWQFAWKGDASRFLRGLVGGAILLLTFIVVRLFKIRPVPLDLPTKEDLERIKPIMAASPRTLSNLVYLGDKHLFINETSTAFVMFGINKRSAISLGDPIGKPAELKTVAFEFRAHCRRNGYRCAFYQVTTKQLSVYLDMGMNLIKLGEEARIHLPTFSLEGKKKQDLRSAKNKLEGEGYRFEFVEKERVSSLLPELKKVSEAWLENKHVKEKSFSLGRFEEAYVERFPVGCLYDPEGKLIAFTTIWLGAGKKELSADIMRYIPGGAPNGIMEYLFTQVMLWGKTEGYLWFNFGMVPLAGMGEGEFASIWDRFAGLTFRYGDYFYNFEGLRAYKSKFGPVWEPRYLAVENGIAIPAVLTDISTLVSGGVKGLFWK